jgi:uncharacterized protein (DUF169 family)
MPGLEALGSLVETVDRHVRPDAFPLAALYTRGGALDARFTGRIDCADLVIRTMQTGECQVVLPCYGDRVFAQTQDHEMAFTVPAARFEEVVTGLEGTARGGIRYPVPGFLRYTGEFPAAYTRVREFWPDESR